MVRPFLGVGGEFALAAENLRLWGNLTPGIMISFTSSLNGDFSDHAL